MKDNEHSRGAAGRIIVALDVPDAPSALELADSLSELSWFKVGLELFTAAGAPLIDALRGRDARLFLDLKLHDIPRTVARAVEVIGRLGVSLTTLHAAGGEAMMRAAVAARDQHATDLQLLAVTVLTSLDAEALRAVGVEAEPRKLAARLARLAADCGMDGVVCSPLEAEALRAQAPEGFLLVTPGIRSRDDAPDDQARVAGPGEAIRRGADYLVIGRPITRASDPAAAARRIAAEIDEVLS